MDSDTKLQAARCLAGGNGQRAGHEAAQNLPAGFKHRQWLIVLVVFYGLGEDCPALQQLSPVSNCQITLK